MEKDKNTNKILYINTIKDSLIKIKNNKEKVENN